MNSVRSSVSFFLLLTLSSLHLVNATSNHPKVIVVAFHGFGNYYIQNTTYLKALKENGASSSYLQPQYITESLPNLQTIATGLFIESHGITGNEFYDTVFKQKLFHPNSDPQFWQYSHQVVPLWTINEQMPGRHSGVMMWPGGNVPYQGKSPTYAQMNSSMPLETRIDTVLSWLTNENEPANLIFMYFDIPGLDAQTYGPDSEEALNSIQKADNLTGYLLEQLSQANILDQVNLIFLSDHGIASVNPDGAIDIQEFVGNSQVSGKGAFLQIQPPEGKTEQVLNALKSQNPSANYHVIQTDRLNQSNPDAHISSNRRRLAPILLMARPGFVFKGSGPPLKGTGGYNNSLREMKAFFLATGPAFKSNYNTDGMDNIDVFPLISNILGLNSIAVNGSLENVKSFLEEPLLPYGTSTVTVVIIIGAMLLIGGGIALYLDRLRKRYYPLDQS